jgi:hypothetical protein
MTDAEQLIGVQVPRLQAPEESLEVERSRVKADLLRLKNGMIDADDQLMSNQIRVSEEDGVINIRYHPQGELGMQSVQSLTTEEKLKFLYGEAGNSGGSRDAMLGLTNFRISPDGGLTLQKFEMFGERAEWSGYSPAAAGQLNIALEGLVRQHLAIQAEKTTNSVTGVKVPEI